MSFISVKYGQFEYFDRQLGHPGWAGATVLDFGGNAGNFLTGAGGAVEHARYWCIDVSRSAVELGRSKHPCANWLFYDRYNYCFNPTGSRGLPIPEVGVAFDYVLAYSVFTHTDMAELHELVSALRARLSPHGRIAFTFIDPHFCSWPETTRGSNLRYRLERLRLQDPGLDVDDVLRRAAGAGRCVLLDDESIWTDGDPALPASPGATGSHHVFYTAAFMRAQFPDARILPPVNGEMQHCCILQGAGTAKGAVEEDGAEAGRHARDGAARPCGAAPAAGGRQGGAPSSSRR